MSALLLASEANNSEVSKALIKGGAYLDFQDKRGCTSLHYWASERNNIEVLEALIKKKAKLNIQDESGMTALHHASLGNHSAVV